MPNSLSAGEVSLPQAIILGLVLSYAITPFVRRLSLRAGMLDIPRDGRRMHKGAVPLAGGAGMIAAFLLSLAFFGGGGTGGISPAPLALFCFLCGAYGLLDDKRALPASKKLCFQALAAVAASLFLARAEAFSFFGYTVNLGVLSVPATACWIVFMMNAVNLTDGMDGLCAGTSAVSAACLSLLLFRHGDVFCALSAASLSGASLGFLFHNRAPAKIFMGETGAAFLGFMLAVLSLPLFSAAEPSPLAAVLPVFLLPASEAVGSFFRRVSRGKNPFAPDKSHIHHLLFARGFSVPRVCALMYLFALLCAFCALEYGAHRVLSLLLFASAVVFMRVLLAGKRKAGEAPPSLHYHDGCDERHEQNISVGKVESERDDDTD